MIKSKYILTILSLSTSLLISMGSCGPKPGDENNNSNPNNNDPINSNNGGGPNNINGGGGPNNINGGGGPNNINGGGGPNSIKPEEVRKTRYIAISNEITTIQNEITSKNMLISVEAELEKNYNRDKTKFFENNKLKKTEKINFIKTTEAELKDLETALVKTKKMPEIASAVLVSDYIKFKTEAESKSKSKSKDKLLDYYIYNLSINEEELLNKISSDKKTLKKSNEVKYLSSSEPKGLSSNEIKELYSIFNILRRYREIHFSDQYRKLVKGKINFANYIKPNLITKFFIENKLKDKIIIKTIKNKGDNDITLKDVVDLKKAINAINIIDNNGSNNIIQTNNTTQTSKVNAKFNLTNNNTGDKNGNINKVNNIEQTSTVAPNDNNSNISSIPSQDDNNVKKTGKENNGKTKSKVNNAKKINKTNSKNINNNNISKVNCKIYKFNDSKSRFTSSTMIEPGKEVIIYSSEDLKKVLFDIFSIKTSSIEGFGKFCNKQIGRQRQETGKEVIFNFNSLEDLKEALSQI